MPPQPIVGPSDAKASGANRQRRQWRILTRWIDRIAAQPGYTHLAVDPFVERLKLCVCQWPVVREPFSRSDRKVGRQHAWPLRRVQHCPAADAVVIEDADVRTRFVDRIVRDRPPLRRRT